MGIRLATFQQHQLTAQDYALLCAKSVSSGIFYGCNVTIKDESTLHVTSGVGIANGRTFDVTDDDYPVELTGGGSMVGRIYVHVDLADADTPAQILVVKGATLPALVQDTDMNESTGVWDLELATFDVDASEISNLVYTASGVSGGGGGTMLAPYYDASEAWLKDQIFQKDGVLYKCLTDIAPGTPLVVDTNVKVTDFAEECEALNQNLTKCAYWNSEDDYLYAYKDGVLTKGTLRLGLLHHYIFINDWQYQTAYGTPTLNGFSPLSNYITVEGGKIKTNLIATNGYYYSLRTEPIENNYNKIIIKGNFGTRTLDTSNFASVYLYLLNYTTQGTSVYYAFASSGLSSPITSCNGATQPLVLLENNTANVPMVYLIDEIYVE